MECLVVKFVVLYSGNLGTIPTSDDPGD